MWNARWPVAVPRVIKPVAICLFAGLAASTVSVPLAAQKPAQGQAGKRFVHPKIGWSVAIPENWPHRPAKGGDLLIRTPKGLPPGFFGIYNLFVRDKTLTQLVDSLEGLFKRNGEAKGIKFSIVSRKETMLAERLPAVEKIKDVGSGNAVKSLRVYVMIDDNKGIVFDGRTRAILSLFESFGDSQEGANHGSRWMLDKEASIYGETLFYGFA